MRKLLNTLYVTTAEAYLSLDGENIVVSREDKPPARIPLHNLESIISFGYTGASPALMGACAEKGIALCFLKQSGRFLGRVTGGVKGNVLLRKEQYRRSDNTSASSLIAKSFILGKITNCRRVIERAVSDHALVVDVKTLAAASEKLKKAAQYVYASNHLNELRGFEGEAAQVYFGVFDHLILQQKEHFFFQERSRRPPLDNVNSLLSFFYTLLVNDISAALESVGLDPYVGFLHRDRPGRASLALDLIEELRPVLADRLALSLINRKQVTAKNFFKRENGGVILEEEARQAVLSLWQNRKKEEITHPYLNEKISWGLVPYSQAMLLARYLRGDLEAYPPFFWR